MKRYLGTLRIILDRGISNRMPRSLDALLMSLLVAVAIAVPLLWAFGML